MLIDTYSSVLKPTYVKFECLRAKRANQFLLSLVLIPDVFGIFSATAAFSVFLVWFAGSSEKCREFRESEVPAIVQSSGVSLRY